MGPIKTSSITSIDKYPGLRDASGFRVQNQKETRPGSLARFDALIAVGCLGGLTISTLYQTKVRAQDFGASDFKTLYASVWSFTHHMNAYSMVNIQRVFVDNGVVQPEKWFGHAPVYPWTTLAFLSPLATMGMVPAAYVLIIFSGILMAIAVMAMMRYAATGFRMGPFWRVALAILCASGPLLGFGMNLGNVSVPASACCFLAFACRKNQSWVQRGSRWMPSIALAAAFLLKPHLALWVGIGMLLLPERAARAVVVRCGVLVAVFTAVTTCVMAAMGMLGLQTHAYFAMLASEASKGASMSATSRLALPVVSQITSLDSILGFWITNSACRMMLTGTVLLILAGLVFWLTRRVDSERAALMAVGSWCALGLLATYHRTADAMLLLILLPWALDRVRWRPLAWYSWAAVACYCAMSASVDFPVVEHWLAVLPTYSPLGFLLLRQAGLADFALLLVMLIALYAEVVRRRMPVAQSIEAEESQAAA